MIWCIALTKQNKQAAPLGSAVEYIASIIHTMHPRKYGHARSQGGRHQAPLVFSTGIYIYCCAHTPHFLEFIVYYIRDCRYALRLPAGVDVDCSLSFVLRFLRKVYPWCSLYLVVVLTLTRMIKSVVTGHVLVTPDLRNTPGKKHEPKVLHAYHRYIIADAIHASAEKYKKVKSGVSLRCACPYWYLRLITYSLLVLAPEKTVPDTRYLFICSYFIIFLRTSVRIWLSTSTFDSLRVGSGY